ncbi:hypothetical protein ABT187_44320 [Streptomyces sp. NPDC001817]|uniref:hypothetical protein n=1 Tax=Streptomyces sp. NPDC001817 TaxID=3154398 RepID=UPI003320DD8A
MKAGAREHAKGNVAKDEDRFERFCVQQRLGRGPWRTVRCARGGIGQGGAVDTWVKAQHRGTLQIRGALCEEDLRGQHLELRWATPAVDVRVC